MRNPIAAVVIAATEPALRRRTLHVMRDSGLWSDRTLDRSFRGMGNAAARRQGVDTYPQGCSCDVCVIYGGDCYYQMMREDHAKWHAARRGVKTRGA